MTAEGLAGGPDDEVLDLLTHELATPVAVILGFARTLQRSIDSLDREQIRDAAARIARGATHLEALVRALSGARAIEVDTLDLRLEHVELGSVVRDVVSDVAEVETRHPMRVDVRQESAVKADSVRLREVLVNLLGNAAKFSPEGTPVEVAVARDGDRAVVDVRDHGQGVPPERLGELFGKYARLGVATRGVGLGLYVSRGIARAHGGDLTLEETGPAGSRFRLALPAA